MDAKMSCHLFPVPSVGMHVVAASLILRNSHVWLPIPIFLFTKCHVVPLKMFVVNAWRYMYTEDAATANMSPVCSSYFCLLTQTIISIYLPSITTTTSPTVPYFHLFFRVFWEKCNKHDDDDMRHQEEDGKDAKK